MFRRFIFSLFLLQLVACGGGNNRGGPVPIRAARVQTKTLVETVSVVGSLVANEAVEIRSEIDGRVDEILFEEGQAVAQGAELLRIDDKERAARVDEARANFELANANLKRSKSLLAQRTISAQEFDRAEAEFEASRATYERVKQELRDATSIAPFAGIVGGRDVSPGQYISSGTRITSLVDTDPMKLEFEVPERFSSKLQIGQSVEVSVVAFADRRFTGTVYFVAPEVDPDTRTVMVKARVPNPDRVLKPGMFGSISLALNQKENARVIPEQSLIISSGKTSVFVVGKENTVEMRLVQAGLREPGQVEIVKGLEADELVVVEGTQKLGPGAPVMIQNQQELDALPGETSP